MKLDITLLSLAFAAVSVVAEQSSKVVCETSDASPYLHNVNEMIDNLKKEEKGVNLCNIATNGCGKTDTTYSGSGGAAFMICGSGFRCSGDPGGMPCAGASCGGVLARLVAPDLEKIRDECQGPDSKGDIRAGGRYVTSYGGALDDDQVKLFSKPG